MMHTVQIILLLMLLTVLTFSNGIEAKKKKCKCKFELNLLTKLIENIEEDVTMLKVFYPYTYLEKIFVKSLNIDCHSFSEPTKCCNRFTGLYFFIKYQYI